MFTNIKLLDAVAVVQDIPEHSINRGQVRTVVELLAPHVFEVEFGDEHGRTYAKAALNADQLLVLHYEPLLGHE